MLHAGQRIVLADLRRQVEGFEGGYRLKPCLPFGVAALDRRLPGGGLMLGSLHEVVEGGPAAEFAGAATLFAAGILARLKGPVLWCLTRRDLFAPGLARAGLHPSRVIYAETIRNREVLPVMEEGLKERRLAAVVGEVTRLGLPASRRLQLAAEKSGVPVLVLRRWWTVAEKELTLLPSAAATRWRISPASSHDPPAPGLGRARWHVDLLRCRGGEPHSWILEACDETGRLALPADLADRPHQAPRRRAAGR
jgi:protein ImuA